MKYLAWAVGLPSAGDVAKGEPAGWLAPGGDRGWGPGRFLTPGSVRVHTGPTAVLQARKPRLRERRCQEGPQRPGRSHLSSRPAPSGISHHFSSFRSPEPGLCSAQDAPVPCAALSSPQATPRPQPTPVALGRLHGSRVPSAASFENGTRTGTQLGDSAWAQVPGTVSTLPKGTVAHTVTLLRSRCSGGQNVHLGFNTPGNDSTSLGLVSSPAK